LPRAARQHVACDGLDAVAPGPDQSCADRRACRGPAPVRSPAARWATAPPQREAHPPSTRSGACLKRPRRPELTLDREWVQPQAQHPRWASRSSRSCTAIPGPALRTWPARTEHPRCSRARFAQSGSRARSSRNPGRPARRHPRARPRRQTPPTRSSLRRCRS
jgi:hypothetical protein